MYFCLSCITGKEEETRNRIEKFLGLNNTEEVNVWFPLKENTEKRGGIIEKRKRPLFPGYLFIWWNGEEEILFPFREVTRLSGVIRILRYDDGTRRLRGNDFNYARWIHSNDGLIRQSKVILHPGQRLHIVDGPLRGMDANVIKIDKHHKKITLRFDFADSETDIVFSVEFLEKSSKEVSLQDQITSSSGKPSDQPSDSGRPSQDPQT